MDASVITAKIESLRRCEERVQSRCPATVELLVRDVDAQDILALNLSRAVQLCVDLALHRISRKNSAVPATMGAVFDALAEQNVIDAALAHRLKSAVGFRNLAVHQYEALDWTIVHAICTRHLNDFRDFARVILPR